MTNLLNLFHEIIETETKINMKYVYENKFSFIAGHCLIIEKEDDDMYINENKSKGMEGSLCSNNFLYRFVDRETETIKKASSFNSLADCLELIKK